MEELFKIRDLRRKDQYKIDDEYLNGYARLCGVYSTAVYNSLSRHAEFHSQSCFPAIETMAEQHNISKKSVIRAIKILESWGIIRTTRGKNEKTKRQLPNVYVLLDKSEWKPKPESRVSVGDSESRVHHSPKPSAPQGKSRVPVGHHKDTNIKDTNIKDNKMVLFSKEQENKINSLIPIWRDVCINWENFYKNKTQRQAIWKLYSTLGEEKYFKAVGFLPKLLNAKYAPKINNPDLLLRKLERYRSFINGDEVWSKAFAQFVPHKMNEDGRKKYKAMKLALATKNLDDIKNIN